MPTLNLSFQLGSESSDLGRLPNLRTTFPEVAYMGQLASSRFVEDLLLKPTTRGVDPSVDGIPWQAVQRLSKARASAIGLPNGVVISSRAGRQSGTALVPIKDAIGRIEQARAVAERKDSHPMVFACTSAHEARSLTADDDQRDWRYLSGLRTIDGFHVYCGGIDAAVSRALAYAPYADVVCYRAARFDLPEAQCFASAIRASFPDKPLGVGFSLQYGFDHVSGGKKLIQLGYSHFFLTFAESLIFPTFPEDRLWALIDDGTESSSTMPRGGSAFRFSRSAFTWPARGLP